MKCIRIVWGHPSPGPETHTKGNGPVTNTFCINTTPMFMASTIQQSEYCIIEYCINSSCLVLRRFSKWLCRSVPAALFTHFAANMTLYDHCWMSEVGRFFTCIWVLCICVFCISIRVIVQIILCPVHPLNTAPGIAENNWRAAADMKLASAFFLPEQQNAVQLFWVAFHTLYFDAGLWQYYLNSRVYFQSNSGDIKQNFFSG